MLTADDLKVLARPFRLADHSFLRGFVYLSEEAITARIEEVDTSWEWAILDSHVENNRSVYTGRLTINGVSKDGVGMQKIDDVGESDKGAATDALKRAARLFGVGRYVLDAPKGNGDSASDAFKEWLAKAQKEAGMGIPTLPASENAPAPAQGQREASRPPLDMDKARDQLGSGGERRVTTTTHEAPADGDLRNKAAAEAFIAGTRKAGIEDAVVLKALGVAKLSQWTAGLRAAGERVQAWQAEQQGPDLNAVYAATAIYWNARKHFDNFIAQQFPDGLKGLSADELLAMIEADRIAQGKAPMTVADRQFANI